MSAAERNLIDYIVVCVSEFAVHHGLSMQAAYAYLRQYRGIDFLKEFYDVEHTLSFTDAVEDLTTVCRRNGGALA